MGMLGQYMMVDETTLDSLIELDNDNLIDKLEELSECEQNEIYDIDKLWDGLHFLLTGKSASEPIEGDRLSEAIVGVTVFNGEDADFIAYTRLSDLTEIVTALNSTDIHELRTNFDVSRLRKARIYPNIWRDNEKDSLRDELIQEYTNLLSFYKKALKKNANIIASIY